MENDTITEIRLGDDKGIRYQGKNYIQQVVAMRDMHVLYTAVMREVNLGARLSDDCSAEIYRIKEKWGLE